MNKRTLGSEKEELAKRYLEKSGMRIVAQNYRNRRGEIDLIGYHENQLVFLEVKYRSTKKMGSPAEAVGIRKQRTICKVADYYRYCHRIGEFTPVRYDVVAMEGEEITWYQNAFPHRSYEWN